MPVFDIVVLSVIVAVFCAFAVVLGGLTWYCSDKRKRPVQHTGHRDYHYPNGGGIAFDD